MKRRESFLPTFLIVAFLCILILVLSLSGKLNFFSSFLEKPASLIQSLSFNIFQKLPFVSESSKIKELKKENLDLLSKVVDYEKLKRENAALLDQFQTSYPPSVRLIKAEIVGAPSFVPGVSIPNIFILNRGSKDNVEVGQAVVVKDNLVGVISQVSENLSKVNAISNPSSSFTAKTQNGVLGVVKGGTSIILDNVLLSENMRIDQIALTKGDINSEGIGIPADLIVGKITSVEKNPSDLFQKGKIESFLDFANLSTVFVYINN